MEISRQNLVIDIVYGELEKHQLEAVRETRCAAEGRAGTIVWAKRGTLEGDSDTRARGLGRAPRRDVGHVVCRRR